MMQVLTDFNDRQIVVIGGGTGSFSVLKGLKNYVHNLTALVNMADDGGSTGLLRDELGVLPPGDVRQCLVALSNSEKVRDLFNYRFDEGSLTGHAFGNIFLTALEKMTGSFAEAVDVAGEVLHITGKVVPVTLSDVRLMMQFDDGEVMKGEFRIGHAHFRSMRPKIWLEPAAVLNPAAKEAIEQAGLIVIAPGNLYATLGSALAVPGMREALANAKAKKAYICNLVTKPGQTDGFTAVDYAAEIERLAGVPFLDYVLFNNHEPSSDLIQKYAHDGEFPVRSGAVPKAAHYQLLPLDLFSEIVDVHVKSSDPIAHTRSYIRHDSDKTARQLMKLYFDNVINADSAKYGARHTHE